MSDLDRSMRNPPSLDHDVYAPVPGGGAEERQTSVLVVAHGALKGRYRWAILLSAVLAAIGGVVGYKLQAPLYRCSGMIDVAPRVPRVLYADEEKGMPPMFESYLNSQVMIVTSARVVEMAMRSDAWQALGRGSGDEEKGRFYQSLQVDSPRRTQCIEVAFVHEDPTVAKVAVNEVIRAFMKVVEERDAESGLVRLHALENERMSRSARINSIKSEILAATDNLGPEAFEDRCRFLYDQVNQFDAELNRLRLQLAAARDPEGPEGARTVADLTPEEIALRDDPMSNLLLERKEQEIEVDRLVNTLKLLEKHPLLVDARKKLAALDLRIEQRAKQYREANSGPGDVDVPRIEKQIQDLESAREAARSEAESLGKKRVVVTRLDAERLEQTQRLSEIQRRIDEINVESEIRGRISVLNEGARPSFPSTDRRLPLAFAGCGGGIALGFGLVILWGMRDARLRHIIDVERRSPRGRFLGIVPEIPSDAPPGGAAASPDSSAAMADYCVHHIRTMLQLGHGESGRVVAFTSPSPGAGKTTLQFALGASFGASGARTLLIDCDFVGHGTSSALRALACGGARRALAGEGAVRTGFVTRILADRRAAPDESEFAALLAACRERSGGGDPEVARALRALESVARGDSSAGSTRPGVLSAIEGRPLEECVMETCVPNLAVLPVGTAGERDAERLSPAGFDRLLSACRDRFDTILVDTGPILGSLEAAFATVKADEVVLVVARDEMKHLVDAALERLEQTGARVAGVVFNRAAAEDVVRSSYASRPASGEAA